LRGQKQTSADATPLMAPKPSASPDRWQNPFAVSRGAVATVAALVAAGIGIAAAILPWRSISPIARPDASVFSAATIERGRQLAALGDCAVCHTVTDGILNAGGRAMETPFGTIYSTNITPDIETGIGNWSYPAFERAMREGIHRDGRPLYPAFPYTHFAKITDADLQALYAYLMAQAPVRADNRAAALAFPFNWRPHARSCQISRLESRRLSGGRPRPLRRLPLAAQRARGGKGQRLSGRRFCGGLGSAAADVVVARANSLERG
jgi:nicotinate dehydrogenase subunit B